MHFPQIHFWVLVGVFIPRFQRISQILPNSDFLVDISTNPQAFYSYLNEFPDFLLRFQRIPGCFAQMPQNEDIETKIGRSFAIGQ